MKCDRCGKICQELFHPADDEGNEYYPDKEYCEECAWIVMDEEDEKRHPNPFRGMTEKQMMDSLINLLLGK